MLETDAEEVACDSAIRRASELPASSSPQRVIVVALVVIENHQ